MRIGIGYDVHKLVPERKLILGGVDIPHSSGLLGHSDADVLLHAIGDALLGAAGQGDLGQHFPDHDPRFKNISSSLLLQKIEKIIANAGYRIMNIDATIIAQKPRLAVFIPKMTANIAAVLKLDTDRINIKATTTEGLGFTGREEGIAAQAVALITSAG